MDGDGDPSSEMGQADESGGIPGQQGSGGSGDGMSNEELAEMLLNALMNMDQEQLRQIAAMAVSRFAGMEPGRPVGGTYYLYRTLRQLDYDGLAARLMERAQQPGQGQGEGEGDEGDLQARFAREEYEAPPPRAARHDRGGDPPPARGRPRGRGDGPHAAQAASRGHRLHARVARGDAAAAARRSSRSPARWRRGSHNAGSARTAATWTSARRSGTRMAYGGVPAEPKFKNPRPSKPEIMVVADISGSVASFARFTLQFVYAIAGQFSKVRSWVFIDGIDEVTRFFQESDELTEAVQRVNTEADVVWVDGHSDYGHAFEVFRDRHLTEVTPKTSIILLGDARNNYHAAQAWVLKDLRQRARRLYWLNPEPRGYWDTGDSIVSEYGVHCDGVYECRNLRQLQRFVTAVVEQ